MSKKTQFTRSKNKIGSLSWTSPIYTHGDNYRNLTQGTNYYIHSKRKKKS